MPVTKHENECGIFTLLCTWYAKHASEKDIIAPDSFDFIYKHWGQKFNGEWIQIYEIPNIKRREFVQFYIRTKDQKLLRITVSKEDIADMSKLFKDFWQIESELKFLTEIDFDGEAPDKNSSCYYDYIRMLNYIEEEPNLLGATYF